MLVAGRFSRHAGEGPLMRWLARYLVIWELVNLSLIFAQLVDVIVVVEITCGGSAHCRLMLRVIALV